MPASAVVDDLRRVASDTLKDIRSISHGLFVPSVDHTHNLIEALETMSAAKLAFKGVSAVDLKSAILTVFNNEAFVSPKFATKLLIAPQNETHPY